MNLTDEELSELEFLVGKRISESLTPEEENRIKEIVSKQQKIPESAQIGQIIYVASIIIGVALVLAALSKK